MSEQSGTLEVGDVVRLNSGGPAMTVLEVGTPNGTAHCTWFGDGSNLLSGMFEIACLECGVYPGEAEEEPDKPKEGRLMCTKCECQFPTEADLGYMEKTLHRHHGGTAGWMKELLSGDPEEGARTILEAIISVWEAGRAEAAITK